MDSYVWADRGGMPGEVLAVVVGTAVIPVPQWPDVARKYVDLPVPVCTGSAWWVGFWPTNVYYVAVDIDGPGGGLHATKVPSGVGYPIGWNDVDSIWGPTAALGIGGVVGPCPQTPAHGSTWGKIKALYR